METKEFLSIIGIIPTKELLDNSKLKQIINYINENDIVIFDTGIYIKKEAFEILLNDVNSVETIIKILSTDADVMCLNRDAKNITKFYNLYNFKFVEWLGKNTEILIDEEYLKYATKEWTENVLFNSNKIIHIGKERVTIRENPHKKDTSNYIAPIELNIESLIQAKQKGILKEVLQKATQAM